MPSSLLRPRLVALLLALLPGLLLTGSEHLRICLHGLIGLDAGCVTACASQAPSGCCDAAPEGPSVSSQAPCAGCCVELAAQATERSAPAPSPIAASAAFALPPAPAPACVAPPPAPAAAVPRTPVAVSPPGGTPTPLRI